MAFLVSNYGKFTPLQLPEYRPLQTRNIDPANSEFAIDQNTPLEGETKQSTTQRPIKRKLRQYEQQQSSFDLKHKIYYAKDIMSHPVHTLTTQDDRHQLEALIEKFKVHHVPIFEDGQLVGIVTSKDLISSQAKLIKDFMTKKVVTATTGTRIQDIALIMLSYKVHCLPIINENHQLVGIITEKDLLRLIVNHYHQTFWA